MIGKVYPVGAGPGAADLLTLRAARTIARADILLYDRLVGEEILALAPAGVKRVYVGKDPAADSQQRQERIYALMIGHAREGKTVVRLKGGDPFVFGRGSEELMRLADAGIPAEVVPGISSCIAAPAQAAIPVTHRGVAASFGVFTGQRGDNIKTDIDWLAAARMETAVFLMGVRRLPEIVDRLIAHGRDPRTPIALIENATPPDQRLTSGILTDILTKAHRVTSPATSVVGRVVQVGDEIRKMSSAAADAAYFENVG